MPKYYLARLPGVFYLLSSRNKDLLLRPILNCLLTHKTLFSITQEPDGSCSILMRIQDGDDLERILQDAETYLSSERYHCLQITTENPGLNESGMLAEVTDFLANANIPILCLSTFNCNYIYYPNSCAEFLETALLEDPERFLLEEAD